MPKASDAKTALAHKKPLKLYAAALVVIVVVGLVSWLTFRQASQFRLNVDGHKYQLLVARTAAEQQRGLGGRPSLPSDEGMLFVFNSEAKQCFWMKDMHFPLDIIWLNSPKKVVYIQPDVSPKTYPETFCPSEPARYVIELNAGQAQAADIRSGETLNF